MGSHIYKKWTSAARYLNDKINRNRIIAGRNILLENTGNGILIHGSASHASANNSYAGGFTLIKSGNDLQVVYGKDPSNPNCGGFGIHYSGIYVPKQTFVVSSNPFYITAKVTYDSTAGTYSGELIGGSSWVTSPSIFDPPPENPYACFNIASYYNDQITQVMQIAGDGFTYDLRGKYWV